MRRLDEKVQQSLDKYSESIDELFEIMLDEARGTLFVVSPKMDARAKPKQHQADFVAVAEEVEQDGKEARVCKSCRQIILKEPRVEWEVYKRKPDIPAAKNLMEQIAGRAKQREQETVDPVIIVQFGDIDSESPVNVTSEERVSEVEGVGEVKNDVNGSPTRTPEPEIKLGL
jgi:hypothetical protein